MKINLGQSEAGEVSIDIPMLIATRMLVTASSGGGKSETLRRILEEAVSHIQCIVIDPEGEFSTLRERKPFVLVGEGGETPADIRTAGLVATRLLELNASAVCDIFELRVQDRHEWVKRFLEAMIQAPKSLWHPVLVVIDEAHTYCPEQGYGKSVASQAVIDLANLGRKRGFVAVLATQRLSKLDKNAVEPLQNYLLGRTMYDDQERAAKVFKVPGGNAAREFGLELERLKDGQFIARGRAFNGDMLKVQVARAMTKPPRTGTAMAGVVTPPPDAIKALLPKLADLPQEAEKKAKTEQDLRSELSAANRRISSLESELSIQARQANTEEVRMLKETINQLQSEADEIEKQLSDYRQRVKKAVDIAENLYHVLSDMEVAEVVRLPKLQLKPESQWPKPSPSPQKSSSDINLRAGARRMLSVLCQWYPAGRTEAQVAAQVQMKRTSGTWAAYKSDMRNGGYFEVRDSLWFATETGLAYIGSDAPQMPSTTAEVVALWGPKLRAGARNMLDALIRQRGRVMSRVLRGT